MEFLVFSGGMLVNVVISKGCYCLEIGSIWFGVMLYNLFFGILFSSGCSRIYVIVFGIGMI